MALIQSGVLGSVSGKVGSLVFYNYRGKNFVRSIPKPSDKPATEKQLIVRAKFREVTTFILPISRFLNQADPCQRKMTAANKAVRLAMGSALCGTYPNFSIDYSKVQLLSGSLIFPHTSMQPICSLHELAFLWERGPQYWTNADDELLLMVYCPELHLWFKPRLPFKRGDHGCYIKIPEVFHNNSIHVWAAFRSRNHKQCSRSQYLGQTIIRDANNPTTNCIANHLSQTL